MKRKKNSLDILIPIEPDLCALFCTLVTKRDICHQERNDFLLLNFNTSHTNLNSTSEQLQDLLLYWHLLLKNLWSLNRVKLHDLLTDRPHAAQVAFKYSEWTCIFYSLQQKLKWDILELYNKQYFFALTSCGSFSIT